MYTVEFFNGDLRFGINNVAFSIAGFEIYWYGILIACGFLAAIIYAYFRSREFGVDFDRLIDVILVGGIGSILCARGYYVLMQPSGIDSIGAFFDLHNGGIAIYGAVIGALVFGGIMCKIRKLDILSVFDIAGIGFLIAQSIGRWGNFVNQEAFGTNTDLPWGMWSTKVYSYLSSQKDILAAEGITVNPASPVHPCFLYESIWCLIGFVLLHYLSRFRRFKGECFLQYIVWYGFGRFIIEGLRTDSLMIGSVRASQLLALLCVIVGVILLVVLRIKNDPSKKKAELSYSTVFDGENSATITQNSNVNDSKKEDKSSDMSADSIIEDIYENKENENEEKKNGDTD